MFPYFINYRVKKTAVSWSKLKQRVNYFVGVPAHRESSKHELEVPGFNGAKKQLKDAYSNYQIKTKTMWGYIKSFIPGTSAFEARKNIAEKIMQANALIAKQEAVIEAYLNRPIKVEQNPPASPDVIVRSDAERYKEHFESPISVPKHAPQPVKPGKREIDQVEEWQRIHWLKSR